MFRTVSIVLSDSKIALVIIQPIQQDLGKLFYLALYLYYLWIPKCGFYTFFKEL